MAQGEVIMKVEWIGEADEAISHAIVEAVLNQSEEDLRKAMKHCAENDKKFVVVAFYDHFGEPERPFKVETGLHVDPPGIYAIVATEMTTEQWTNAVTLDQASADYSYWKDMEK